MNINLLKRCIQFPIFESRWFLLIFYYGLIISLFIFGVKFIEDIWGLIRQFNTISTEEVMISVLHFMDLAMIANLAKMVGTGSYQSFVEKVSTANGENPSSGGLKVKMATSLCIVCGMNLLPIFLKPEQASIRAVCIKTVLIGIFLILSWVLSKIEKEHAETKIIESKHEKDHSSHSIGFNTHTRV